MKTTQAAFAFLAVAVFSAWVPIAPAQTNGVASTNTVLTNAAPPPPRRPPVDLVAIQTQRLSTLLKLTEEQKPRVKAALEALQESMKGLSPDQKRAKRQELQEMLDARFKTILTPEQFEHWQTLQGRRPPGQRAPLNPGAPSSEAPTNSAASH